MHEGPDLMVDLLRSRYRLSQDPATFYGMSYEDAALLQAGQGTDELASRLFDRFQAVAREHEVHNALLAFTAQGCNILAMIANRVAPDAAAQVAAQLPGRLPVPVYVLPALTNGCLVVTPGDRVDLIVGALAAHSSGSPPIAGVLLTLGERPGQHILALADRLAPGTPVISVPGKSFPIVAKLFTLEGKLTAAPRKVENAMDTSPPTISSARVPAVCPAAKAAAISKKPPATAQAATIRTSTSAVGARRPALKPSPLATRSR
jgi:phosphate acetyltransferase